MKCICTNPECVASEYHIYAVPINPRKSHSKKGPIVKSPFRWGNRLVAGIPHELDRWREAFLEMLHTDVLIIPGTGLLTDAYGLLIGWGPYNLFKWCFLAKVCGCKIFFVSVGAGPLCGPLGRSLIKLSLAMASYRSYRDEATRKYLNGVGFPAGRDPVFPDLAFSLPTILRRDDERRKRDGTDSPRRPVAAIGVMDNAERYAVENRQEEIARNYLDSLTALAIWLIRRGYDVRLLIGDVCDRPMIDRLKEGLRVNHPDYDESRVLEEDVATVEELLSQIASADIVVATRFHNVLFALLNARPVVAISFHHKVASLMEEIGLSDYCLDINRLGAEDLLATVTKLEDNVGTLIPLIQYRAMEFREALELQYDRIMAEFAR